MFNLSLIIEQVLLENKVRDKVEEIADKLIKLKDDHDRLRKIYRTDKNKIKSLDSDFILKRIDMRYELADLVKNEPFLKKGRSIVSEKDLDEYIENWKSLDKKYDILYIIMAYTFPNPTKHFQGLL
jgi:hypothetical protein